VPARAHTTHRVDESCRSPSSQGRPAARSRLFLQWFALPGVQLYSLQKGLPEEQLKALPEGAPIVDFAPLMGDFADTAAVISELDLVVVTNSVVAHLTGALGKPI